MARLWAGFPEPSAILSLLHELKDIDKVSILIRDPHDGEDIVVIGPLTHDMGCYPFLDIPHQFRQCGVNKFRAERYAQILERGGALVCVDEWDIAAMRTFKVLHAQEISM